MLGLNTAAEHLAAGIRALRMRMHAAGDHRPAGDDAKANALERAAERPAWAFASETGEAAPACGLPVGCAVGVPFAAGTPVTEVPEGKGFFSFVMNLVQDDDYHGLLEVARCGRHDVFGHKRRCGFSMTLMPEGSAAAALPTALRVHAANMLHYAVCIGTFRAAAALLIINPSLLHETCKVRMGGDTGKEETWDALELARLFCDLYSGSDSDAEIRAMREMYEQGHSILELGLMLPKKMPFLNHPTVEERVAAAGPFAENAIAKFLEAADSFCVVGRGSSV
jgi:hypothetical protein